MEQMLNEILDQLRGISLIFAAIALVFGALQCFFGYKIFRFWIALIGFVFFGAIGNGIGYATSDGNQSTSIFIALLFACLGAFLAYKLYAIGVFIQCSITAFFLVILFNALNGELSNGAITLGIIIGVIVGIIGVILIKHMIIITTSFSGGLAVGNSLAVILSVSSIIGSIIGVIISILGLIVQYKMNDENKSSTKFTSQDGTGTTNNANTYNSNENVEPIPVQQNVTYTPSSYNETIKEVAVSNPEPNPKQQEISNPVPSQQEINNAAPIQPVITNAESAPKIIINTSVIYCSKCGAANKTTSKFCTSCGNKITKFN